MTVFLVIQNNFPILAFATRNAAERFCSQRSNVTYREFTIPAASAEREEIKNNLKEFFLLKQELEGKRTVLKPDETAELEKLIEGRYEIHQAFLESLWRGTAQGDQIGRLEGECPQTACPGRMAMGITPLT